MILDSAYENVVASITLLRLANQDQLSGSVHTVARGDLVLVVLPSKSIPELNLLPGNMISSERAHVYNLIGHFNGMDIVTWTDLATKPYNKN